MTKNEFMQNPHLDGEDFFLRGNPTSFLLIHGFTATTTEVRPMAEKLHQAGYTTAAPLLPGHGTHPDDLNRSTWQMWLEKVKQTYERLMRDDHNRIFIIAESMGALLAIELAAQHPEIDGLILFSPALKVEGIWLARLLAPFKDYIKKNGKDDGLPWKGYIVYPVKAMVELYKLQKHVQTLLPKITQPTLVFTGGQDQKISSESIDILLNGLKSTEKHHINLEKSGHTILLDQQQDEAFEHILKFINQEIK